MPSRRVRIPDGRATLRKTCHLGTGSIYLDENNSGEYELTDDEVMKIITNEGFRKTLGKRAWEIIVDKGPGNVQHQDTVWKEHRFYNNPDGDLWSAFNDIRFNLALDG